MSKTSLVINMPRDAEINAMFDAVPILERHKVPQRVLRAGAMVVKKRAVQLTPRGTEEDRNKRSARQRAAADWETRLYTTIGYVVRGGKRRRGGGVAVIGPTWPKGNKAYFFTSPKGTRAQWFWGRYIGIVNAKRNWLVQAFDETRQAQLAAMKVATRVAMDRIWRHRAA